MVGTDEMKGPGLGSKTKVWSSLPFVFSCLHGESCVNKHEVTRDDFWWGNRVSYILETVKKTAYNQGACGLSER